MKFSKTILIYMLIGVLCLSACNQQTTESSAEAVDTCKVQFSADSAYQFVVDQCAFGPRVPNSAAHDACGDWIVGKFRQYGLTVTEQKADIKAWDGVMLHNRNIIASWKPEAERRIIICAHWDSRPWADADTDANKHHEPVMAANDGASGVAVMLEMARVMKQLNPAVGIDFACFDMEDYGTPDWSKTEDDPSHWALGAQHWAKLHAAASPRPNYEYGILLDMVGGRDAQFCYELYSLQYASSVVARVWGTAESIGFGKYFPQQQGGAITDDHGPMNEAGVPTIDIIPYYANSGFGPTWHTTHDTPENIDPQTLRAVGQTLIQVLYEQQ